MSSNNFNTDYIWSY